ncbi:MAG: nuclear transport factor 2 family protein [Halieaceae bacterium]|nr:nuclear transport factor 2 family protein [Halieaceae bacterium]
MSTTFALEDRIKRLEDKDGIRDLIVMYCIIMDEKDFEGIERLFTKNASLTSADGVFNAHGLDAIKSTYQERWSVLGASNHVTHGNVVRFANDDPDQATGVVTAHAEVIRAEAAFITALRYKDKYQRTSLGWQISERELSFMYYVSFDEFNDALVSDEKIRVYGDRRSADWPEQLYKGDSPRWIKDYIS